MNGLLLTPYFLLLIDTPHPALRLLSEPQTLNHTSVAFHVLVLHIVQEPAPLAYQLEQPSSRRFIVRMRAQVLRKLSDTCSEQGHLDFR